VTEEVLCALKKAKVTFDFVDDLCGLTATRDKIFLQYSEEKSLRIAACYPRAVKTLFHWASAPLNPNTVIINMRTADTNNIVKSLLDGSVSKGILNDIKFDNPDTWTPWFPVIDYSRCKNCKQCLNFCLFGVYELDKQQKVKVAKPANCKTGCPACARVCPERAIIFPKYGDSHINGDEIDEETLKANKPDAKLSELLTGDVREALTRRSDPKNRFTPDKDEEQRIAELARLKEKLDIPSDVISRIQKEHLAVVKRKTNNE
jgi:NAD-dependent dihydropyrimidine dehydrogenase PreA subunit